MFPKVIRFLIPLTKKLDVNIMYYVILRLNFDKIYKYFIIYSPIHLMHDVIQNSLTHF